MNKEALIVWLRQQQTKLENILLTSAQEYYSNYASKRNFSFDAKETGQELWVLKSGGDLCYDRPTIGFNYSMWYHPKRINTFLKYFVDLIYESRNESNIEIFDLGAGTGAVLWSVGLITQGLKHLNMPCPKIRVINIDTSAFMLYYNYNYLWKNFISVYPEAVNVSSESDYKLNSWSNLDEANCTNIWLCASYLFDHSENAIEIANDFKNIVNQYRPNKVLMISSSQSSKVNFCNKVAEEIRTLNYRSQNTTGVEIFSGQLNLLYQFRNKISLQHNLNLKGTPQWNIDSLYGTILINNSPTLGLDFNQVNLFTEREENRVEIKLTSQQAAAAEITQRPTLIVGPAGCGKSVVLTEKIKNILDANKIGDDYNPKLKILLTTFNKELVKYLAGWLEQILTSGKFRRLYHSNIYGKISDYSFFQFSNSDTYNISVMHFDVLPTKIGGVAWHNVTTNGGNIELFHLNKMKESIEAFILISKIDQARFQKILDPEFLLDEYHRVVYGNLCNTYNINKDVPDNYAFIAREGRGNNPQLKFNSERRRIVWSIINIYLRTLKKEGLESFIIRRHRFLKKLLKKGFQNKFTHIIVDEFQDCTQADYEIFYQILSNPNHLTLAGDIAQSIQLGASLHIPRSDDQRNFLKKKLEGSFRLPFRISECIKPLSESINQRFGNREGVQSDVINPYKGSPPGSRPIFIYASDTNSAAEKISEIFAAYKSGLTLDKATIFERDFDLSSALYSYKVPCDTEIILRTKGLEKKCVVWSTRIGVDSQNEKEEFIYTILTRTVSLLIVVVFPETAQEYLNIIRMFVPDKLIRWDEESEKNYFELMHSVHDSETQEDQDNSEDNKSSDEDNIDDLIN